MHRHIPWPERQGPARRRLARVAVTSGLLVLLAGGSAGVAMAGNMHAKALAAQASKHKLTAVQGTSGWSAAAVGNSKGNSGTAQGPPASLGSGWKETFSAAFTGSKLDTSTWGTCYPWEPASGCTNFGNQNVEFQWYTPAQDQVSGGALHLVPQQAPTEGIGADGKPKQYDYRSGIVTTYPSYHFQYGYVQVVAQIPTSPGAWSALWLAASNQVWPPEIDILEHWGERGNQFFQYFHPVGAPQGRSVEALAQPGGWHTFSLYWSSTELIWYIDGQQVYSTMRNIPQQSMYFLANVAVSQPHATLTPAAEMDVKSVTIWQQRPGN